MKFFEPCWSHKCISNGYILPHTYLDLIGISFQLGKGSFENITKEVLAILRKFEKIGAHFAAPHFSIFYHKNLNFTILWISLVILHFPIWEDYVYPRMIPLTSFLSKLPDTLWWQFLKKCHKNGQFWPHFEHFL